MSVTPSYILAQMLSRYTGESILPETLQAVAEGASGRSIMRSAHPACAGVIAMHWTPARADNAAFLPAAHGLKAAGVRVPTILAQQELPNGCGACLAEDLGSQSLLSLRDAPWPTRREAYLSALRQLHLLHHVQPGWQLQPAFDAALYRWEQAYFAEHYLQRHCGMSAEQAHGLLAQQAWGELAAELAQLPRSPIHRDCQSQNIMLRKGEAYFIDFQGMRLGLPEYDLASLLYDPYMALAPTERAELLAAWESLSAKPLRPEVYAACALQRLMQALGAFANIGYNMHNAWYLHIIPAGELALQQACHAAPPHSLAAHLATCLLSCVTSSS